MRTTREGNTMVLKRPAGPRGNRVLGSVWDVYRDPLRFVLDLARDYGDVARYRVAHMEVYQVNHPAGATVSLSPYVNHHDPAFWENPEGFDPERFSRERSADRPQYAYFPFGGGPRQCIGKGFALAEATLILALLAQRLDLHLLPGQRMEPRATATLRPRHGVMMAARPRRGWG